MSCVFCEKIQGKVQHLYTLWSYYTNDVEPGSITTVMQANDVDDEAYIGLNFKMV
jgi:hypothetical protein